MATNLLRQIYIIGPNPVWVVLMKVVAVAKLPVNFHTDPLALFCILLDQIDSFCVKDIYLGLVLVKLLLHNIKSFIHCIQI